MQAKTITVSSQIMGQAIAETVRSGGSFVLAVTGSSMRPMLKPGRDQVCLTAPGKLRRGDIVFFQRVTGEYILHRIIRMDGDVLTVNGDSQSWTEAVERHQVIAVVSRVLRRGKWYDMDQAAMRAYSRLWPHTRALRPGMIKLWGAFRK